jgi:LPS sulfotransferase NodH
MFTGVSYLVCATPRSGSSFLCEVLSSTGVAGRPDDYFWSPSFWFAQWGVVDFAGFAERLLQEGATANGVFGSKLMRDQLDGAVKQFAALLGIRDGGPQHVLAAALPNLHYIWLTRRDKVRQGISYYRAMETEVWRSSDVSKVAQVQPSFSFEAIQSLVQLSTWEDQAWQDYFRQHTIEPCKVEYEDLLESPAAVVQRVLCFLGIPAPDPLFPEGAWRHQRQSDAISEEWLERYKAHEDSRLGIAREETPGEPRGSVGPSPRGGTWLAGAA